MTRPEYMILPITDRHHKGQSRNIKICKFSMVQIVLLLVLTSILAYDVLDMDENLWKEKCPSQMDRKVAYLKFSLCAVYGIALVALILNTVYKAILIYKYGKTYPGELHCERTRKAMGLQENVKGTRIFIGSMHCNCQRCNDLFNSIEDLEKGPKDESKYSKLGADIENALNKLPPTLSKV